MKKTFLLIVAILFAVEFLCAEVVAPNGAKQLENYRTSWIGNSFGGIVDGKPCWVQQDIAAMCVTPDGTVYTNIPWEEAGGNCSMYKDGKMLGSAWHTHGWGYEGGKAVAANEKYVFIALRSENEGGGLNDPETWPPKGFDWHGVSRRLRSDFTKGAPFEHGKGGKGDTLPKSFLVVNEVPVEKTETGYITGLWATEEKLYVSNPLENRIEIYDTETMQKTDEWTLSEWALSENGLKYDFFNPGQIAADPAGNLWIHHTQKFTRGDRSYDFNAITQFSPEGVKMKGRMSDGLKISSIGPFCFGPDRMFVFDSFLGILVIPMNEAGDSFETDAEKVKKEGKSGLFGTSNQIQGISFPLLWPWGEFGDLRFGTISVKAIGCDAAGNVYIAQDFSTNGGGAILESYRPTGKTKELPIEFKYPQWEIDDARGKWDAMCPPLLDAELNWRLFGLCFIDNATLDPLDETVAYTKDEVYKIDWSKTEPGSEWSLQTLTTMNHWHDPRNRIKDSASVWVRYLEPSQEKEKAKEKAEAEIAIQLSVLNALPDGEEKSKKIERCQKWIDKLKNSEESPSDESSEIETLVAKVEELEKKIEPLTESGVQALEKSDLKNQLSTARAHLHSAYSVQGYYRLLFVNDMNSRFLQVYQTGMLGADRKRIDIPSQYADMPGLALFFAPGKIDFSLSAYPEYDESPGQPEENVAWNTGGFRSEDQDQTYTVAEDGKPEPPAQGWWVDSDANVWRATETQGIRRFSQILGWGYDTMLTFPHPKEFSQVKRIRYDVETDTLYLGGCATVDGVEHKNQHWKPMGPVVCRYDNFLKEKGRSTGQMGELKWKIVLPYVSGSKGHESCEPMGFDIAGDYMFVPYTGASKEAGVKTGRVEVYRLDDGSPVGWMEPDPETVGEIGLQDIRECLSAHRLSTGEYVVFLEDDFKAKVVMYRLQLP